MTSTTSPPDGTPSTLHTLVVAARGGDDNAWSALFTAYHPLLLSIARAHDLSSVEAADAAQATWERFVTNIDRLDSPSAAVAWLATTTRRECYAVSRRRSRERATDDLTSHEQTRQQPPDGALTQDPLDCITEANERQIRRECLHAAVGQLPASQARLMKLLLAESDLSYAEISARLRMPIGSIGPVRRRAFDRLRNSLASQLV